MALSRTNDLRVCHHVVQSLDGTIGVRQGWSSLFAKFYYATDRVLIKMHMIKPHHSLLSNSSHSSTIVLLARHPIPQTLSSHWAGS